MRDSVGFLHEALAVLLFYIMTRYTVNNFVNVIYTLFMVSIIDNIYWCFYLK